jgi:hypothetical protein
MKAQTRVFGPVTLLTEMRVYPVFCAGTWVLLAAACSPGSEVVPRAKRLLFGPDRPPASETAEAGCAAVFRSPSGLDTVRLRRVELGDRPGTVLIRAQEPVRTGLDLHGEIRGLADRVGPARAPLTPEVSLNLSARAWPQVATLRLEVHGPQGRWVPESEPAAIWDGGTVAGVWRTAGPPEVPWLEVPRWVGPRPAADGRLSEPGWARAARAVLVTTLEGSAVPPERRTILRLAWDGKALMVAFEASDPDVTRRYRRRDDPIYQHEAVELFLMPRPAGAAPAPYLEMQASPAGVIFDASFTGPRQGFRTAWNGRQRVGTTVDGTLGGPVDRDRGWISEWVVPWDGMAWVTKAPDPGDVWRGNAFRIDASRERAGSYQAWSPPRVGDFHRVERFGWLRFAP